MPSAVDSTASASPTASVSSPGSAPREPAVEKRSHGVSSCCARPLVERLLLFVRRLRARNRLVAPHRRPLVVGPDARDQIRDVDVVFRLRDVVEARVVHHRRRVAHLLDPLADRAPCPAGYIELAFMLCWKPSVWPTSCATTYSISRPIRSSGSGSFLRARIERTDLQEVPVARQVHHVVIELDVGLEDLAGARIVDVRTRGILDRRRQPADHRIAGIFGAPVGILLRRRRLLGDDRVLESGRFERLLPASRCPASCTAPTWSASPDRCSRRSASPARTARRSDPSSRAASA